MHKINGLFLTVSHTYSNLLIGLGARDAWLSAPQLKSCKGFVCPFHHQDTYDHLHNLPIKTVIAR
jgi:hypothetical protein